VKLNDTIWKNGFRITDEVVEHIEIQIYNLAGYMNDMFE
jgi:hypothetical protein